MVRSSIGLPRTVVALCLPLSGSSAVPILHDLRPTARISPDNRFYFKHIQVDDVLEAVHSTRSNARGPDDIPISLLKECLPIILPILLNIFDCSLQSGVYPSSWKMATVRPLAKRHPPVDKDHLRPISILCAVSKVLEKVAFKQIDSFEFDSNELLDPLQSGFRKRHSNLKLNDIVL